MLGEKIRELSEGNRKQRRLAARMMGLPIDIYPPRTLPIDLGINKYKKLHVDEPSRVAYYKREMWKAFHELHGNDNIKDEAFHELKEDNAGE